MTKEQAEKYITIYCQNENISNYNEIIDYVLHNNLLQYIVDRPYAKRPIFLTKDKKFSVLYCSKNKYNSIKQPVELETHALLDNFIVSKRFENIKNDVYQNHIVYNNKLIIIDEEVIVGNPNLYLYIEQQDIDFYHLKCIDDIIEYQYDDFFIYDFFRMNAKIKTNVSIHISDCTGKTQSIFFYGKEIFSFTNDKQIKKITLNDAFQIFKKNHCSENTKKDFIKEYVAQRLIKKQPLQIQII